MIITSSFGIIIKERKAVKVKFLPLKSKRANAYAASTTTINIKAVVTTVKIKVFKKYLAKGTAVKACVKFSKVGLDTKNFGIYSPL